MSRFGLGRWGGLGGSAYTVQDVSFELSSVENIFTDESEGWVLQYLNVVKDHCKESVAAGGK